MKKENGKRMSFIFLTFFAFFLRAHCYFRVGWIRNLVINLVMKKEAWVVPKVQARVAKNISEIQTVCKQFLAGNLITWVSPSNAVGNFIGS